MKKSAIIVDIDGTLSNPNHRRHYVEGENKDWEQFFAEVSKDPANTWCSQLVNKFFNTHKVILVTGRPETSKSGIDVRRKTKDWLDEYDISYDRLIMREEGDFRKDTVVKEEILEEELPEPKWITFAVDDREDIVELWRSHGIPTLHCEDEVEDY